MDEITVKRILHAKDGTTGVMIYKGRPVMLTLEDPWLGNQSMISCIPPGKYDCLRHNTVKFPNTWQLQNVPGRTAILIHAGNTEDSTNGCILVGRRFQDMNGKTGIAESQLAMTQFRDLTKSWKTFAITIEGAP